MVADVEQWVIDVENAARSQNWPQAIAWAERALALGLIHPRLLQIRAIGRQRSGKPWLALDDLSKAHALDPSDPGIANALGSGLTRAGRHAEALAVLQAEVAAHPEIPETWFNLGAALVAAGQPQAARSAFERASELRPDFAEAFGRLAILAIHRGDAADGKTLAERALGLDPGNPDARRAQIEAAVELRQGAEAEGLARAWLQTPDLGANAKWHASGLLGDALDLQGRYAEAFQAYTQSKATFAAVNAPTYRALEAQPLASTLRFMQGELHGLSFEPGEAKAGGEPEPGRPRAHVFLMGFMRSGTTLLEQALSQHPDVVGLEEAEAMANAGAAFLGQPGGLRRIAEMDAATLDQNRAAYFAAVRQAGVEPAGKVLIDKLPFNGVKLPLIHKLFPEARIIFCLRDPRDVVLSCFQKRLQPNGFSYEMRTLEGAARFYASYMELVRAYRDALDLALMEHRHEALVGDLEGAVRAACAFIGLDFQPGMTEFHTAARDGAVMSQTSRQLREGVSNRGLGRWRAYAAEMAPVAPILRPWAEGYGYGAV